MVPRIFLLGVVLCYAAEAKEKMYGQKYYDGKKVNIPMSHEAGVELWTRWAKQSISSVFSSIAQSRSGHINEFHRNLLFKCTSEAEELHEHAKCIVAAMDAKEYNSESKYNRARRVEKLRDAVRKRTEDGTVGGFMKSLSEQHRRILDDKKRRKRQVTRKRTYKLKGNEERLTSFGFLGKFFSRTVSALKNRTGEQSWSKMISDVADLGRKMRQRKKIADSMKKKFAPITDPAKSKMYQNMRKSQAEEDIIERLEMAENDEEAMAVAEQLLDKQESETAKILRSAMELATVMAGENGTQIQNKSIRVGSPRLLSMVPDNVQDSISFFSPSLLSLHEKGNKSEALLSLPSLMRGMDNQDYEHWMNFILESSGVPDVIDTVKDKTVNRIKLDLDGYPRGIDNQPMYFTKENVTEISGEFEKRKVELFEALSGDISRKQLDDFKQRGYSTLTKEQLQFVYGKDSPFNDTKSLNYFSELSEEDIHDIMLNNIRSLAKVDPQALARREKRRILSPVLLEAAVLRPTVGISTILSPILLSASILSASVLGPVILSPFMFFPVILSPRLVGPAMLSPSAFAPFVLTPVVMRPIILSPQVLNAFVLCPILLTPFILSPNCLAPIVLCPLALTPSLYNPSALRAIILSPLVLAPSICSPRFMVFAAFSPNAFSPAINSPGKSSAVFMSPSAFS